MMRDVIHQLLVSDATLLTHIPAARWYGSGSVDQDPPTPFAETRLGGVYKGMSGITRRRLEVWIHDAEGDYGRIDRVIEEVKRVLDGRSHESDEEAELILAEWVSDSTDLYDDGYRTNTKSTGFDIIGKGV